MPNNGVLFFPMSTGGAGGGGSTPVFAKTMSVGALTAGVTTTLTHSMGYSNFNFQLFDASNNIVVDTFLEQNPADPTNKVDITSSVNVPAPLYINILGF